MSGWQINMKPNNVFELIKLSLWGEGNPTVDLSVYQEMKSHAIATLPASVLSSRRVIISISPNVRYSG